MLSKSSRTRAVRARNVWLNLDRREVDTHPLPSNAVQPVKNGRDSLIRADGHQQTALRPRLADVSALNIAREDDQWGVADDLARVDMPKGPVVVPTRPQLIERARCIPFMSVHAAHTGVQEPDIEIPSHGLGITGCQILSDGSLGEALPVDRHVELVKQDCLGAIMAQEADILRKLAASASSCSRRRGCPRSRKPGCPTSRSRRSSRARNNPVL